MSVNKISKERLKSITIDGIKYQLNAMDKNIKYLENNGLELCADWLENETISQDLNLSFKEKTKYVDYMVKIFYEKIDEILEKNQNVN